MSLRTCVMLKIIYGEEVRSCFSSCCATNNCRIRQQVAHSSWRCERTARLPNLCDSIPFTSPCALCTNVIVSEVNVAPQGCELMASVHRWTSGKLGVVTSRAEHFFFFLIRIYIQLHSAWASPGQLYPCKSAVKHKSTWKLQADQ